MSIKDSNIYDKIRRNDPYFENMITRSIYHSNSIEGNTLSYAETYAIVFNDNTIPVTAKPRELYEAVNLKYAMNYILENLHEDINPGMVKHIGVLINKNIDEIEGFRKEPVFIKGAEHIPPDAAYVPELVSQLLYEYRNDKRDFFEKMADFHLRFERIHPFKDGNGRTGRILLTKEFLASGYAPVVIPIEDRALYMNMLADQNVNKLASYFEKLNTEEETTMNKYGINLESTAAATLISKVRRSR
ncbi:MAG: Fic family protein [Clostridiales bacterium]|nr:Fic family protein [Clostridiales bacterium]